MVRKYYNVYSKLTHVGALQFLKITQGPWLAHAVYHAVPKIMTLSTYERHLKVNLGLCWGRVENMMSLSL